MIDWCFYNWLMIDWCLLTATLPKKHKNMVYIIAS